MSDHRAPWESAAVPNATPVGCKGTPRHKLTPSLYLIPPSLVLPLPSYRARVGKEREREDVSVHQMLHKFTISVN